MPSKIIVETERKKARWHSRVRNSVYDLEGKEEGYLTGEVKNPSENIYISPGVGRSANANNDQGEKGW